MKMLLAKEWEHPDYFPFAEAVAYRRCVATFRTRGPGDPDALDSMSREAIIKLIETDFRPEDYKGSKKRFARHIWGVRCKGEYVIFFYSSRDDRYYVSSVGTCPKEQFDRNYSVVSNGFIVQRVSVRRRRRYTGE